MTFSDFHRRAYAVGCAIRVSGPVRFYSKDGNTVRVTFRADGTPAYAVSHLAHGKDIAFMPCTVAAASKALKLPRQG